MDDKFLCGIALGMIGGALIVANSVKARKMIIDGQSQILDKMEELNNSKKKDAKQQQ